MLFKPFSCQRVNEERKKTVKLKPRVEIFHMKTEAYKYRITLITLLFRDTVTLVAGVGRRQTCVGGKFLSTFALNKN